MNEFKSYLQSKIDKACETLNLRKVKIVDRDGLFMPQYSFCGSKCFEVIDSSNGVSVVKIDYKENDINRVYDELNIKEITMPAFGAKNINADYIKENHVFICEITNNSICYRIEY